MIEAVVVCAACGLRLADNFDDSIDRCPACVKLRRGGVLTALERLDKYDPPEPLEPSGD